MQPGLVPILLSKELAGNNIGVSPWGAPSGGTVTAGVWSGMADAGYIPLTVVSGVTYKLTSDVSVTSGQFYWLAQGSGTTYRANLSGSQVTYFTATSTTLLLYCVSAGTITVYKASLKKLAG